MTLVGSSNVKQGGWKGDKYKSGDIWRLQIAHAFRVAGYEPC